MTRLIVQKFVVALLGIFLAAWCNELHAQGDDPDVPGFLRDRVSKDEYLQKRAEHVGLIRGLPYDLPYDPRVKAINEMREQARLTRAKVSSTAWTPIGPAPLPNGQTEGVTSAVSGRVTCIAVHPANPNIVYVGTAQGGLYRTVDGGAHWTPLMDDALSLAIGAIAIVPSNPSQVYVGTGEPNGSADSYAGVGLYRIDNADTSPTLVGPINPLRNYLDTGGSPQSVPVFSGRSISKILVLPGDPATIFVGVAGGVIGLGGETPLGNTVPPLSLRGLYKLTNATGVPASVVGTRIPVTTAGGCFDLPCTGNRNVNDMVFDPGDPSGNTLILWLNGTSAANDGGVWRSTNAMSGSPTFTQSFATTSASTSNGRGALAIYKRGATPAVVYAANGEPSSGTSCGSASQSGALRVSTDGGVTFSSKLAGGGGFCGGQCFYNIGLAVVPGTALSTDRIHIGGNVSSSTCQRLHAISLDGGATFTNADNGLHADTHAITVAPSDSTIVYLGSDGGVFKSTNSGTTWVSLNTTSFDAVQFQSIALHPTDQHFTIGGTQDNGTPWRKPDQSWTRADFGDGGFSAIDQNAVDVTNVTMYHTYFNQTNNLIGFARVTNTAVASDGLWTFLGCNGVTPHNGITCGDAVLFYAPLVLGPGTPNTVYFGSDRLYRSIDMGTTNTPVSQTPLVSGTAISAIAISPQDDNYRMVGLTNGALFFTATGSSSMTVLDPTGGGSVIPDKYVGRIAFDPLNKNTAYIAVGGYMGGTAAAQAHVWRVRNLGSTPVINSANGSGGNSLPDVPVNALVVDPSNSANIFAGTDIGVYSSTDSGATWTVFGTGLPRVAVFDMAIHKVTRVIRIATHGRGMWENSGPELPIQLSSFTVTVVSSGVELAWETLSEVNNFGFEVQKATAQAGEYRSIPNSFVRGHGATNVPQRYTFTDYHPDAGNTYYRLKQLDLDGTLHYSDAVSVNVQSGITERSLPTEFSLQQAYPNPFNPVSTIRYGLPVGARVRLEVYNVVGQRVAVLVDEEQAAGYHEATVSGGELASGAYFYTIQAGEYRASKKLVLNK